MSVKEYEEGKFWACVHTSAVCTIRLRLGQCDGTGFCYPRLPARRAYSSERGDLAYWRSTLCGVLEYWSDGVMENNPFFRILIKPDP